MLLNEADDKMFGGVSAFVNGMLTGNFMILACVISDMPSHGQLYMFIISFFTSNLIVWIRDNYISINIINKWIRGLISSRINKVNDLVSAYKLLIYSCHARSQ